MASPKKYDELDITKIRGSIINNLYQISFLIKNNMDKDYKEKAVKLIHLFQV